MTPEKLLRELEKLPYSLRIRRVVEIGRAAANDKSVADTLAKLEQGNVYERQLSLQSCFGSRDGEHVLRALNDPSQLIRGLAVSILPHVCSPAQVGETLHSASPELRLSLVKPIYRRNSALVDALLERLAEGGSPELLTLLPYGSHEVLARYGDEVLPIIGWDDWRRFAKRHPNFIADWLNGQVPTSGRIDTRLVWQVNAALPALTKHAPDAALSLVRSLAGRVPLPQLLRLSELAYKRTDEVVALVLEQGAPMHLTLDKVVDHISTQHLIELMAKHGEMLRWRADWFPRLSPEKRLAVYQAQRQAWYSEKSYLAEGALGLEIVSLLPREQRELEARRHLSLPSLQAQPAQRIQYAAFLPWVEARSLADPYLRDPDADIRAAALGALITATQYHRAQAGEVLELVRARRHEQDPVRGAVLARIADLPPSIWKAHHLDALGQVIQHAFDAKDLSSGTTNSIEQLLISLVPFHPEWGGKWLAALMSKRAQPAQQGVGGLFHQLALASGAASWTPALMRQYMHAHSGRYDIPGRLSDADVRRIAPQLLPVLRSWETREYGHEILSFAQSLGRRLRVFDDLIDLLERLVRDTRDGQTARGALNLIIEHRPERAGTLIPDLLRRDGSVATLSSVYLYMHLHRQDLLTPYLGQKAHRGRFATGKSRFVLPLNSGFHRWTARQQELFARTLQDLIADPGQSNVSATTAAHTFAALPSVPHRRLVELASLQNREQVEQVALVELVVRDAALMALGRLDDTQEGVPALLEALGDERARTAIYALRSAVLRMPPARVITLLGRVALKDVSLTVAKEIVRLIGDLKSEEALRYLLALDRGQAYEVANAGEAGREGEAGEMEALHRDLRIALLRSLWNYLDHDEVWPILERAAASSDPSLAAMAGRTTTDRMSPSAQEQLVALIAGLIGHPEPQVRLQVLERCAQLPVRDDVKLLMTRLLERLDSDLPEEVAAAAKALFATCGEDDADIVGSAVQRLMPRRRSLQATVQALIDRLMIDRRLVPVARGVLDALQTDRLTAALQAKLVIEALGPEELASALSNLARSGDLHFDSMNAVVRGLEMSVNYSDPDSLERLEALLSSSGDERLRRLALAALAVSTEHDGWTEERLARLRAFRSDPSFLVAAEAQFTLPAVEAQTQDVRAERNEQDQRDERDGMDEQAKRDSDSVQE